MSDRRSTGPTMAARSAVQSWRSATSEPYDTDEADLVQLLEPLRGRLRTLGLLTLSAALFALVASKCALTKWYRANAVLHPVSNHLTTSNALNGILGGGILMQQLASGGQSQEVWEYISVLKSCGFTQTIVQQYHIKQLLTFDTWFGRSPHHDTTWELCQAMLERFDAQYELKSGNLLIHFDDPRPAVAGRVLSYYIEGLRTKLRNQEVEQSSAAIESLEQAARGATDASVQTQLYGLVAEEIEQKLSAQVRADFAFKIIEAPIVADNAFWPSAVENAIFAALLTGTSFTIAVLLWHRLAGRAI